MSMHQSWKSFSSAR